MTDNRTIADQHNQLMWEISVCDNMIDPKPEYIDQEERSFQAELAADMTNMCQQLSIIEEVMFLTQPVDCDCFYAPR
jgi:hypothetical protein